MRVCVVSFKECWQDATGCWFSYGGFPLQAKQVIDGITAQMKGAAS